MKEKILVLGPVSADSSFPPYCRTPWAIRFTSRLSTRAIISCSASPSSTPCSATPRRTRHACRIEIHQARYSTVPQTILKIDPAAKPVTTDNGTYAADHLVVALRAAYNSKAAPGLTDVNEFYTVTGAERLCAELQF